MIRALFVDIGGCLLTNGWDANLRAQLASQFGIDLAAMNVRHEICFDALEKDAMSLEEYLEKVVFYEKRPFSIKDFQEAIFSYSTPYPEMIELIKEVKSRYALKVVAVSNENRTVNEYRIKKFSLDQFIDSFISSCYVNLRKPDLAIYRMALDTAHVAAHEVVYIEDRPTFVLAAEMCGIKSICHKEYQLTKQALEALFSL